MAENCISRTHWPAILADFRRSGLSQAEFCNRRGLSVTSFRYRYYRAPGRPTQPNATKFLPVRVVAEPPASPPADRLVLILAADRRLAVAPGFDAETLARLLNLLERQL